jgi:hypothetical protein
MPQELEQKSRSPAPSHTAPLSNAPRVRSWHLSRHTPRPSAPTASKQASKQATPRRVPPQRQKGSLASHTRTQYPILPPTQRGKGGHAQAYRVRGRRGPTRCRINRAGASWQPCCRQGGPLSVETQHSTARHGTARHSTQHVSPVVSARHSCDLAPQRWPGRWRRARGQVSSDSSRGRYCTVLTEA